tara:strand:- start:336 stop:1274 length:939 start_codon:yes stop_codon:yes gene_type:complete
LFDDYKALRAFRAVVEAGTLTKAARRLGVTQPAVSRLVFSLERQTGLDLFKRERQRLHPTDEAMIFYQDVVRVLSEWEGLPQLAADIRNNTGERLKVVTIPKLGTGFFPNIMAAHESKFPKTQLTVHVCPNLELEKLVASEQVDVGISRFPLNGSNIKQKPLFAMPAVIVAGPNHWLAGRKSVGFDELVGEPIIAQPRGLYIREMMEREFHKMGKELNIKTESGSTTFACRIASQGIGICMADAVTARWVSEGPCTIVGFHEPIMLQFGITYHEEQILSEAVESFIATIEDVVAGMLEKTGLPYEIYPYQPA